MPLTRGDIIGYDAKRLVLKFTMRNGAHVIECEVSNVALSDLAGMPWRTVQGGDREAKFILWRDTIEKVASDLFDAGVDKTQTVQIFAKHFPKR
jgi:hypothetical protein